MPFSMELPNGFTMNNIPDGTSDTDIAKRAVQKGYATPMDFADYPEIYKAVGGKGNATQAKMAASINDYAHSVPVELQHDVRDVAAGFVVPGARGLSWVARAGVDSVLNAATAGVQSEAENIVDGKNNDVATNMATAAVLPGVIHTVGKLAAPVLERFTPSAVQYLKGRLGHVEAPEDIANAEKYVDESPVTEVSREQEAEKAIKAGQRQTDRVDALTAQQAQWLDEYNQKIAHRLVGVEAESYALNGLKETDTAEKGMTAKQALQQFREFTEDYENPHLPFPGDEHPELSGYGQFEQVMRASHDPLNELITKIDSGEDVSSQRFYNALASYIHGTKFELERFLETSPHVNIKRLLEAVKDAPDTLQWLDAKGILNPEMRRYVSAKQAAAHRAGVSDAYTAAMERLDKELSKERSLTSAEYQEARAAGERNVQTALDHKIKLLDKIQKNVKSVMNDAKGIKANGVKWSDIPEDERAIYWAMTHTHDAAQRGAKAMRLYEQLEAIRASLPGVRDETMTDKALDNTAAQVGAGFMFGGPVGAVAAPVSRAVAQKVTRAVVRRVVGREERAEIEAAAKKIN
ncbi:hypothetical protein FDX19_15575 [Citrobacter sp. wls619]|uniref:hypothetical protein n=1 Tax=Citrobacter sp. wls619 TaxID=2576432 RepID=UPI0010C9AD0B|nr:hypothetical protein [Citrobacter sp. wls619]TKV08256.1 hypothetical protein FDX19_15575 [Citrobacter sp. wls619]